MTACASGADDAPIAADSPTAQQSPDVDAPQKEDKPVEDDPAVEPAPEIDDPMPADIVPIEDPELDKLLDKLEKSADDLRSFTARITYRKFDSLLNRNETRSGEIIVLSEPVPDAPGAFKRKFAVLFEKRVISGRLDETQKHYIFDGRWLAEIDHERKIYSAREIVPPGRTLDPLKLGEGPFPLPIGQLKSKVLERFVVNWAPAPGGLLNDLDPDSVYGITLTPRAGTEESDEFRRVDIYYDKETLLPVGIETVEVYSDDRKTVLLRDLKRNQNLDEQTMKKVTIERPDDPGEWTIDERAWQG